MSRENDVFYWLPCSVVFVSTAHDVDKFEHFAINTQATGASDALIPEGAAAWMACNVESTQDVKGYRLFISRVVDQADLGTPPLVLQKDTFFCLQPQTSNT